MSRFLCRLLFILALAFLIWLWAGFPVWAYPSNPTDRIPWWWCANPSVGPDRSYLRYIVSRDGEFAGTVCLDPEFVTAMLVLIPCESGEDLKFETIYRREPNGTLSAGRLQINSVHQERMENAGWNWYDERDRWRFAQRLWREQGVRPWSCSKEGTISLP